MEMMRYVCVTEKCRTADGYELAAGCICRQQAEEEVRLRLKSLKDYRVRHKDLFGIDYDLAEELGRLMEDKVIATGVSLCVPDADIPEETSTGGVLGDPAEKPESSDEDIVDLSENFYMYTEPGGPGLAANAFGETVRQALLEMKKLPAAELTEESFRSICRKYGITVALLIYDGTGAGRKARLAAMDLNGVKVLE